MGSKFPIICGAKSRPTLLPALGLPPLQKRLGHGRLPRTFAAGRISVTNLAAAVGAVALPDSPRVRGSELTDAACITNCQGEVPSSRMHGRNPASRPRQPNLRERVR